MNLMEKYKDLGISVMSIAGHSFGYHTPRGWGKTALHEAMEKALKERIEHTEHIHVTFRRKMKPILDELNEIDEKVTPKIPTHVGPRKGPAFNRRGRRRW